MFQKKYFPTLKNNPGLAYFDSASSTQTHVEVLDAMQQYYNQFRSNTGRGEYSIANTTTEAVDTARAQVADLLNVDPKHIIFTAGATDGLNMIAEWCKSYKTVIITEAEHNANIVPWLEKGFSVEKGNLKVVRISDFDGMIDMDQLEEYLSVYSSDSLLMSFCATSNVTGVTQDWETIAYLCHKYGAAVAVDFCQTVAHRRIDLTATPVEWAVFSGHKMYGPTGVGVLYTAFDPSSLRPQRFGGGAVTNVNFARVDYAEGVARHEPGTPNVASIIGIGVAAELLTFVDFDEIHAQELRVINELYAQGFDCLPGVDIYPQMWGDHRSVYTLVPRKLHSSDIATLLSHTDVAVRTGRVCAHPFVDRISAGKGIVRISIAPYNTKQDVETLISELKRILFKYD